MAWTVPEAWSPDEVVTSTKLNQQVKDNLNFLYSGGVLQVVSTTLTTPYTMASNTFTNVTGLTATITPAAASSKVLVIASLVVTGQSGSPSVDPLARLVRGTTGIFVGTNVGSRTATSIVSSPTTSYYGSSSMVTLDSPSTTSATTYAVQVRRAYGSGTVFVNRHNFDDNADYNHRMASSITLIEVGA